MNLIGKIWKVMPREMRTWLTRRAQTQFTVSAGGIITNERAEVLLLDHVLRPNSGWGIPGGFLEKGEQPEAAFRREIKSLAWFAVDDIPKEMSLDIQFMIRKALGVDS